MRLRRSTQFAAAGVAAAALIGTAGGVVAMSSSWSPSVHEGDGPTTTRETSAGAPDTTVDEDDEAPDVEPPAEPDELDASLSVGGQALVAASGYRNTASYAIAADIDVATGRVDGHVRGALAVGNGADEVHLRWFPGVAADRARIDEVLVDGAEVDADVDESLITIELPDHGDQVVVDVTFGFRAPAFAPPAPSMFPDGDGLRPDEMGLLARSDDAVTLGHWFPVWIPDGDSAEPDLDGYGDIANFPAADIVADLRVDGTVVTSGVRLGEPSDGVVREGGVGLRDLAVIVVPDAEQRTATTDGGVEVVVTAPAGSAGATDVLQQAVESLDVLSAAFGAYPWAELDVVAVPLDPSVGGMEWPGMVWIESTIAAGGIPGVGDLGDLGELGDLGDVDDLGDLADLGDLLGGVDLGSLFGDVALVMETTRSWTVAHEVGHMWWHSLIGNDSLEAPVIDEPLAQHSACLVMRATRDDGDEVCDAQTASVFAQYRALLGIGDSAADRASDRFASSLQYGAVVYGKAPMLYRALEDQYGEDAVTAALATFVADHAFTQVTPDDLRAGLGEALGDTAGVDALWQRWMEEAHGDEDLGS